MICLRSPCPPTPTRWGHGAASTRGSATATWSSGGGQEVAAGVLRADTAALALGAVCDCLEYEWETDPEVALEIDSYAIPDRLLARESREVPLRGPGRTPFGPGRNREVFETTQELLEASAYWQDPPAWIHGPKTPDF